MSLSEEVSSDEFELIARDIEEEAEQIKNNLLPKKSSDRYIKCYDEYEQWKKQNKITSDDEKVLLVYFNELSQKFQPSTLWSRYSMIRSILSLKKSINIKSYYNLKAFLKNNFKGYIAKKSKVLSSDEIAKFLTTTDDRIYLLMKVILIFGMFGALRTSEYCNLQTTDIDETENEFIIRVRDTKNFYPRVFIIGPEYYQTVKKYKNLRPPNTETTRFFIYYNNGTCTRQPCGKKKIYETPKNIARFLNLPEPNTYTGHCFRRSSTTALANTGVNSITLKEHGGWRSSIIAEGYVEHSLHNKRMIYNKIASTTKNYPGNRDRTSSTIVRSSSPATISETPSTITHSNQITHCDRGAVKSTSRNCTTDSTCKRLKTDINLNESNDSENENSNETVIENRHSPPIVTTKTKPLKSSDSNPKTAEKMPLKSIGNTYTNNSTEPSTSKSEKNQKTSESDNIETNITENNPTIIINIKEIHNVIVNNYYKLDKKDEKEN